MTKKKAQTVFNVYFYNSAGDIIDQTQIDEKNEELAWELFAEFGHTKESSFYLAFEPVLED